MISSHSEEKLLQNTVPRIYFFGRCYCRGGGTTFFFSLIEYLLAYTDIKIGIIDFPDGIMARTAKKFYSTEDIDYINDNAAVWDLEDNSCIFTPTERLALIKKIKGKNIRILNYFWNNDTGWRILLEKLVIKKVGKLLRKTNAVTFMDYGNWIYACRSFHQCYNKNYIPLYYRPDVTSNIKHSIKSGEINLVWLGRIAMPKANELVNIIENFHRYQTNRKKIFHIIGNGVDVDEKYVKSVVKKYKHDIDFRFTGLMVGLELTDYLVENADVGIAMGMSILNFAALKIPVICAHNHRNDILRTDEFKWFFNMVGYNLGSPTEKPFDKSDVARFENIEKFDDMLNQVVVPERQRKLGEQCYEYFLATHANLEFIGQSFVTAILGTTLTYEKLKKCLLFMPYGGPAGVAVHTYKIFGLPMIKVRHHDDKMRVYFCGIEIIRKTVINGHNNKQLKWDVLGMEFSNACVGAAGEAVHTYKIFRLPIIKVKHRDNKMRVYLCGMGIIKRTIVGKHNRWKFLGLEFSNAWWGRYSFPHNSSAKVRKECGNVYAINKRSIPSK